MLNEQHIAFNLHYTKALLDLICTPRPGRKTILINRKMAYQNLIPWQLKIIAKLLLTSLNIRYAFWQKVGLFRHGAMDNVDYAMRVFYSHLDRAGLTTDQINSQTILEIGPGDSISTAIIAASYSAKTILLDNSSMANNDYKFYQRLSNRIYDVGVIPPNIASNDSLNDILNACNSKYITNGLDGLSLIPDSSVKYIFSHAVLEHIRKSEFVDTMSQCRRILSNDGIVSHRVDLADHLGGGLNNLRFNARLWESNLFANSGFYTNRLRFSEILKICEDVGFKVISKQLVYWDQLPIKRNQLSPEFRSFSNEELCIKMFDIILKKA